MDEPPLREAELTDTSPDTETVHIVKKKPVGWLNLALLVKTGILAAISAATGNRTPRREVLAALDIATSGTSANIPSYFDYSCEKDDEIWIDYVADLGDGFDATHSIAWLVGRDYIRLEKAGTPVSQPLPPGEATECGPDAFKGSNCILPAGRTTIFGGDLVYPFATQTEYEDRTIGPYHAARPWQLDAHGKDQERRLFSIPGNHDWYDGLGAFVQRFCQPRRWMGCWQVQQRRSYFAVKLPHQTWLWGVDLATADDFDAPQLEYFTACARDLARNDQVILCVPKPAWVDREIKDNDRNEVPTRSWESWNKIEKIKRLVERRNDGGEGPRVPAVLSGDLHHYSRYESQEPSGDGKTHFVTCGGGGAFLLGTDVLPERVSTGTGMHADLKKTFPTKEESKRMHWGVFKLLWKHKDICVALGSVMLAMVWYLETVGPASLLAAVRVGNVRDIGTAFFDALLSSPFPPVLLVLTFLGFWSFANSGARGSRWRSLVAGLVHMSAQLAAALLVAAFVLQPIAGEILSPLVQAAVILILACLLGWFVSGLIFAIYLFAAKTMLDLHWQEIYSSQAIEDWKGFLRIRVNEDGITIFPIGLKEVCHRWKRVKMADAQISGDPAAMDEKPLQRVITAVKTAAGNLLKSGDGIEFRKGTTHLFQPDPALAPHLIEDPVKIPRKGKDACVSTPS